MGEYTEQEIKNWRAYEKVRKGAKYNMFDPRAQRATGLTWDEYRHVLKNYAGLKTQAEKE